MKSREFKRWLAEQGCSFDESAGKGSHIKVRLGDKWSTLPMHNKDLPTGTLNVIKKQLGLKGK